jgi:NADPH:quinone reductase-like Zn-dependent oxidoreductase
MLAVRFVEYGAIEKIEIVELDRPVPKEDEVLIKIYTASLNEWDNGILNGTPFVNKMMFGLKKPSPNKIPGCDFAGIVEVAGKNCSTFKQGDEVFGDLSANESFGAFAEYVCVNEKNITKKPTGLSFEAAASLVQAGLLAYQSLRFYKNNLAGKKVLINGAGGGAGATAIQLAVMYGAEVTAVDNKSKLEFMKSLGAHNVVDFQETGIMHLNQHFDLIIDLVAHYSPFQYLTILKPKGSLLLVGGNVGILFKTFIVSPIVKLLTGKSVSLLMYMANRYLDELARLTQEKKIKTTVDRAYTLDEIHEMFRYYQSGDFKGKLVLKIAE